MRRLAVLSVALAMVVAAAVLAAGARQRDQPEPAPDAPSDSRPEHVILVDWDGFDPDYLGRVPTPNLDALVRRGSLSTAESTYPTVSNSARASMVTGAYPERHGNLGYFFDRAGGLARAQDRAMEAETITEALAAQGRTSACVQWYMVEDRGVAAGDPQHLYVAPGGPFADRVSAAIEILNRRPVPSGVSMVTVTAVPDFLAVYGDDLDALAHAEGKDSPNVGPLLSEMDRQLGRLVQATKDLGLFEVTSFLLTSDHGMTDWSEPVPVEAMTAVTAAGLHPEVVAPGSAPAPETDVIVVATGVRLATISLRGAAATPAGRETVAAALSALVPTYVRRVLNAADVRALHAGDRLGDFVAEAQPPYGFAASAPASGRAEGAHGSTAELAIPLVVSGPGFRAGVSLARPGVVDVAPTIAALLAVRPPAQAQGRSLTRSPRPRP